MRLRERPFQGSQSAGPPGRPGALDTASARAASSQPPAAGAALGAGAGAVSRAKLSSAATIAAASSGDGVGEIRGEGGADPPDGAGVEEFTV